ncbi:Rho GTPase activation protein [Phycomyces blakesleeanus]|uniref:Rho GTPase activation protein n=1 Tax=Phycomyces blakesleeanus TaxID=4837 RepID=A0ABR3B6D0_PHYBL
MPNFMNIGSSLCKELEEDFDDVNSNYHLQQMDIITYYLEDSMSDPSTPDLVIEGEGEYDSDDTTPMSSEDRFEKYWNSPNIMRDLLKCQSYVRTWLERRKFQTTQKEHRSNFFITQITNVQACVRGNMSRRDMSEKRKAFESSKEWITLVQAACRGTIIRKKKKSLMEYYLSNISSIITAQNIIRKRQKGNAYHRLNVDRNPSVGTVKRFVHMLVDGDLDFESEQEIEDLQQQIIEHIRENKKLDEHVNMVDVHISLFLKNVITIEDAMKCSGIFKKKKEKKRLSEMVAKNNSINLHSLSTYDKPSRDRLIVYQQFVYCLQTEPKYLARLLQMTNRGMLGSFSDNKIIENTVLTLFGYGTTSREEYLLLNLCKAKIKQVRSPQEFMRGNYTFMRLIVQTNRGAKERHFFRNLLSPLVESIISNQFIDLETNPVKIYQKSINNEETRTGRKSSRVPADSAAKALEDPEVREIFFNHLQNLQEVTRGFMQAITEAVDDVPYGIRVIALELNLRLENSFPKESREYITKVIGNFIYYRYLNPAIVAPEQYDVTESIITPMQRQNLAEVSKVLHNISSGKLYDVADHLSPLNRLVQDASQMFSEWFSRIMDVKDPETFFGIDQLGDQTSVSKPIVCITPSELFHLHRILQDHTKYIIPEEQGTLYDILQDLGPAPDSQNRNVSEGATLTLRLTSRLDTLSKNPASQLKQMLDNAKRIVIHVLRIQSGADLYTILNTPVEVEHEYMWTEYREVEFPEFLDNGSAVSKKRYLKVDNSGLIMDIKSLTFNQLKNIAKGFIDLLEKSGAFETNDTCQELINMIANDITNKNSRRAKRDEQIQTMRRTLDCLVKKQQYLRDQGAQYEGYLNGCLTAMAVKRGKKSRFVFPFTRQYFHIRGLQRQGLVPKYGSYKYTAKQLYDRGIIVSLGDIPEKHFERVPIILSMDRAGIVVIEGSYSAWGIHSVQVDMRYEDLLQAQYDGVQTTSVLDGAGLVNVNLLIHLINKKFYA